MKKWDIEEHRGETKNMNNGMNATIVAGDNSKDITIQFEDGTIVEHRAYNNFCKGGIMYPFFKRIGETRKMKNGMYATIIAGENPKDVSVQFEDGTIVKHKQYDNFCRGKIGYSIPEHIGETKKMKNGMYATIIEANGGKISLRFEDGTIIKHREYGSFRIGNIGHSNLGPMAKENFHGFNAKSSPISLGDDKFYKAINLTTGEKVLITPQKMIAWEKEHCHENSIVSDEITFEQER